MSERTYPSRRNIVARYGGAVIKVEATTKTDNCVPTTVAFTHGYTEKELLYGLHIGQKRTGVIEAAQHIAESNRQELIPTTLLLNDVHILKEELSAALWVAESAWLTLSGHRNGEIVGHMLGVIPIAPGKYVRWDTNQNPHLIELGIEQLASELTSNYVISEPNLDILSFVALKKRR